MASQPLDHLCPVILNLQLAVASIPRVTPQGPVIAWFVNYKIETTITKTKHFLWT